MSLVIRVVSKLTANDVAARFARGGHCNYRTVER
jgi:hypothetical protein